MKIMKMKQWAFLSLALLVSSAVFAGNFVVDASNSTVSWNGKKVTGEHYGSIDIKDGSLEVVDGEIKGGTVTIDMQSIKNEDLTNQEYNQKLVGHLKSDDFFSVESHPTATLVLTDVKKSADNYTLTGDLTIKGITKPVSFQAASSTQADAVTLKGKLIIDRSDYNVRYGSKSFFDNLGDKMIYDDFTLDFVVVAKK
ncbi:YceI family protein [Sunxiuqinia sp. sy24]|uniref:YceI family protein n=1 Tax=Sunxiuqinia sp. sy24 TaxID=3461495 RepID=UPI0040455677